MAIILTDARQAAHDDTLNYHAYCCMDSLGNRRVFGAISPGLDPQQRTVYQANMAFQAPCMAMVLRGIRIDPVEKAAAIKRVTAELKSAIKAIQDAPEVTEHWNVKGRRPTGDCCRAAGPSPAGLRRHNWQPRGADPAIQLCGACGEPRLVPQALNPNSSAQCIRFFYDILGMAKRRSKKRDGGITVDDDALEALALKYPQYAPLLDKFSDARGLRKQLETLNSRLDEDGRWRMSLNVGAAETGRMSSSKSPFYSGNNVQNVADKNRGIFVADPGLIMGYVDYEQAESNIVAHDAECGADIDDHEAGDTHTALCKRIWPDLPWGQGGKTDKEVAQTKAPWDPDHDYRHYAKIIRHGTNIGMTKVGIAREARCAQSKGQELQDAYFAAYPEDFARQKAIRNEIRMTGSLTNPLGVTRLFMGRPWDESTMKEGLAQTQQSTVAYMLNFAMWRVWWEMDTRLNIHQPPNPRDPNKLWLHAQVHDALLFQVRPGDTKTLQRLRTIMETPCMIRGKAVTIRAEILLGKSWKKDDLTVWKG